MSTEIDNSLIENNSSTNTKTRLSIWNELSGASIGVGIGLICIIIASIVFYIFMNLSPAKHVKVVDDAGLFTEDEIEAITKAAKKLSSDKDINVVIVTTRDKGKGYSNSDDDEKRYAEDYYMDHVKTVPLQNHSGVCILVDLTLDEPGQGFFWLYTYGTAHFAVANDECSYIFRRYYTELGSGAYGTAIYGIVNDLGHYTYTSYGAIVFFTLIIPVGLAWVVTALVSPRRKLDKAPPINTYSGDERNIVARHDKFKNKKVIHYESSGGGGFSGGGGGGFSGGGFSGGGGGGFSGGGGGRF